MERLGGGPDREADLREQQIIRLEERIAATVATSRDLIGQIEAFTAALPKDEKAALEERWLSSLNARISEFEQFQDRELQPALRAWRLGVAGGAVGLLAVGAMPALVALGFVATMAAPAMTRSLRSWLIRQRALATSRNVSRVLR